jgi:hypothetical protein
VRRETWRTVRFSSDPKIMNTKKTRLPAWAALASAVTLLAGCNLDSLRGAQSAVPIKFSTEYQAVFLDNGQVYFGKLENPESTYPLLRNVFYVQNQVNQETKQTVSLLVKRGKEWHEPDVMYLNQRHVVMVEPVAPNSKVGQLIKQASTQPGS